MSPLPSRMVRLVAPLATLLVALVLSTPLWLGLLALGVYGALLGLSGGRWTRRILIVWLFVGLGVAPLAVGRESGDSLMALWGWGISSESLALALRVGLRAIVATGAMFLLLELNPIYLLCSELRRMGLPRLFVDLIELSYRYINLLLETGEQILQAQRCRLGYRGIKAKIEHSGLLFAQSFVLAHSEAEAMYEGLLSRQYDEPEDTSARVSVSSTSSASSPRNSLLSLRGVGFAYGSDHEALRGITLDLTRGERIALLGANGAGKSTLMRLITGLIREQSGELHLLGLHLGRTDADMRLQRQRIALVMQNANHQLFCPSVQDEIAFGLKNIGLEGEALQARVERIIAEYELEALRAKPPHLLSEGQKKWVSIAAVLALDPDLILLDEPTAALDAHYTKLVLELLDRLHAEGKTIILSTHDMNLAYSWASRALVLSRGELIYDGPLEPLFASDTLLERARIDRPYGMEVGREAPDASPSTYRLALYHRGGQRALVVGGGRGAWRKVQTLVEAGLSCHILAPECCAELTELHATGAIQWQRCSYTPEVRLSNYHIVIAGTGDEPTDRAICMRAMRLGLLACSLSDPLLGNIQLAAQAHEQGIDLAVHTEYRLPEIAQAVRNTLAAQIPPEWGEELKALSLARERMLRASDEDEGYRDEYQRLKDKILKRFDHDRVNRD